MADELTIWQQIAAPLDATEIMVRDAGGTDVPYIDRTSVEVRLNTVCPGEWSFTITPITVPAEGNKGAWVVKGALTIQGVTREDFGMNDNLNNFDPPKAAVSDAFKRCAALFGFGRECALDPKAAVAKARSAQVAKNGGKPPQFAPAPASATKPDGKGQSAANDVPARPMNPQALRQWFDTMYIAQPRAKHETLLTTEQQQALVIEFNKLGLTNDDRHAFASGMFGVPSFKGFSAAIGNALHLWLRDTTSSRREASDFLASLQPEPEPEPVGVGK